MMIGDYDETDSLQIRLASLLDEIYDTCTEYNVPWLALQIVHNGDREQSYCYTSSEYGKGLFDRCGVFRDYDAMEAAHALDR